MKGYQYQNNYSDIHKELYNRSERTQKANKTVAVLEDYFSEGLQNLKLLDIGSSTGIMTQALSEKFADTTGIDIDEKAVKYAKENFENEHVHFFQQDSMDIKFPDNSFDVVNCTHIYEHVPDRQQLIKEIFRVLKPGGICFFGAANRLVFIEPHYRMPFLSVVPKSLAHRYIRLFKKADFYYETLFTYWGLKKLVSQFEVIDYTREIIKYPIKYYAAEMIQDKSLKQFLFLNILKIAYWTCPTYIWLLKKTVHEKK